MSKDEMSFGELMDLEDRLRRAEAAGGEEEAQARVLRRVQTYAGADHGMLSRPWGRRLSMFAVVGIPAAAAAAIAGIILLNAHPQRALVPTPATTPSPVAAPNPSPAPTAQEPLLVMTRAGNDGVGVQSLGGTPNDVMLLRRDGTVVAQATFKAAKRPLIANAATIMPPQAVAAADAAYYVDGDGVVRRLGRDGRVSVVASFPTTAPQHITTFAVSPEGSRVIATVFTFGAPGPGLPGPFTIGPSYDNLEAADAGGPTRILSHAPLATSVGHFMVVGWDAGGPLAGTAVALLTQNALPAGWESPVFHLDPAGNTTDQLGGTGCTANEETPTGMVLCSSGSFAKPPIEVRSAGGSLLWAVRSATATWSTTAVAPSGRSLALGDTLTLPVSTRLYSRDSTAVAKIPGFVALGWLGETALIGFTGDPNKPVAATIEISSGGPARPVPFPSNANFVGYLPGS